jgi:SAM-dependent methyltransferase
MADNINPTSGFTSTAATREITYLSAPAKVSMADRYYDIASTEHFWIRRRFRVLNLLAGDLVSEARRMAEVGCGTGLLQRQIEDAHGREVAGFDLNEVALKKNVSRLSSVHCYNILERNPALQGRFDVIFLFDVLEHVADEIGFLNALIFHLSPGGRLILNVPACQWAYAEYDRADGHLRRYSINTLRTAVEPSNFGIMNWTYWGLPLVPLMLLRKILFRSKSDGDAVVSAGFAVGSKFINQLLGFVAKCEAIPQRLIGSSLMAILQLRP